MLDQQPCVQEALFELQSGEGLRQFTSPACAPVAQPGRQWTAVADWLPSAGGCDLAVPGEQPADHSSRQVSHRMLLHATESSLACILNYHPTVRPAQLAQKACSQDKPEITQKRCLRESAREKLAMKSFLDERHLTLLWD